MVFVSIEEDDIGTGTTEIVLETVNFCLVSYARSKPSFKSLVGNARLRVLLGVRLTGG